MYTDIIEINYISICKVSTFNIEIIVLVRGFKKIKLGLNDVS